MAKNDGFDLGEKFHQLTEETKHDFKSLFYGVRLKRGLKLKNEARLLLIDHAILEGLKCGLSELIAEHNTRLKSYDKEKRGDEA